MSNLKILVVDDEWQMRRTLRTVLIGQGFEVLEAACGEEAIRKVGESRPDMILLDLRMPGIGGIDTCRAIRANSDAPVMVISAKTTQEARVSAFEAGADQFLTKPVGTDELIARIHALKRRVISVSALTLQFGDTEVNLQTHEVKTSRGMARLTAKEFRLLYYMASHHGEVITHRRLLQAVWGPDYGEEIPYLRVFVNQLRKKIEPDPSNPRFLLTEPSWGYRLSLNRRDPVSAGELVKAGGAAA